jgi:hypothetical protein
MQINRKRSLLLTFILILLVTTFFIGKRYIPYNRILHIAGPTEATFVNRQQINSDVPHSLYFDFEVDPKSGNSARFNKGIAHSGQYSSKAFGKDSYSFSVERTAGEIGLDNLGAVSMSAWVYVFPGKVDPTGNMVFAASNGNINITWKAIIVSGKTIPHGKWFKISGMFDLSDVRFKPDTKLVVYFWNTSRTDILVDDFYIVFGGPKPHRGDSTLVDLSKGNQFTPRFNFAPYPFHFFAKEEINNDNSSFLIKNGRQSAGDINPSDRIFSGHFLSDVKGKDDLLVIDSNNKIDLFSYCKEKNVFRRFLTTIPVELHPFFQSATILNGCFSGTSEQLLLSGPKGLLIGEFDKIREICNGDNPQSTFRVIFKTTVNPLLSEYNNVVAADLEGNGNKEIMATSPGGAWKIFRYEKGKNELKLVASGESDPLKLWNQHQNEIKITAGRFLQKYQQELLLTVARDKKRKTCTWSILRFDEGNRNFVSCFSKEQQYLGKTIGLDTLKPGDEFFTGIFGNDGKIKVFRYNRDWRYDLKEIKFNDSTFQVIANMDFTGYLKDYNPKYFEVLKLVPGMLINQGQSSLLAIGKNHPGKEPSVLPPAIQVYTIQRNGK